MHMVGRAVSLAGIATLMGAIAAAGAVGCANDDDGLAATDVDAGTKAQDAGRDVFVPPSDDDDDDERPESCASKEPVDATKIPYTKALRSPGACSRDEVETLVKYYDEQDPNKVSVASWAATVSDTCAACAFTVADADEWGPLLVEGDKFVGVSRGGCIEIASGKEACGRAYEQTVSCIVLSCLPPAQHGFGGFGTCATQSEFDACRAEVLGTGPCAVAYAALQQECGSDFSAYEEACRAPAGSPAGGRYAFEGTIPAHCGGSAPDEGADAGD